MPNRQFSFENYRYSINGQEKETELNSNITSAEFWIYDSRLGRRWNVDPKPTVSMSVFAAFQNNPIVNIDPFGDTTINGQKYEAANPAAATYLNNVTVSGSYKGRKQSLQQREHRSLPLNEIHSILLDQSTSRLEKIQKLKETEFKYKVFSSEGVKDQLNGTYRDYIKNGKSLEQQLFREQLTKSVFQIMERGLVFFDMYTIGMSQNGGGMEVPFIGGVTQMMVNDLVQETDQSLFETALTRGYPYLSRFLNGSAGARSGLTGVYTSKDVMLSIIKDGGLIMTKHNVHGLLGFPENPYKSDGSKYDFFIFFSKDDKSGKITNFGVMPIK